MVEFAHRPYRLFPSPERTRLIIPRERLAVGPESEGSSSVLTTALEAALILRTSHVLRILDSLQPLAFQRSGNAYQSEDPLDTRWKGDDGRAMIEVTLLLAERYGQG